MLICFKLKILRTIVQFHLVITETKVNLSLSLCLRESQTRIKNTNRDLLSFCARTRAKRDRRTSSTHTTQRRHIFLSRDGSSRAHTRLQTVATDLLIGQPSKAAALHHGHAHTYMHTHKREHARSHTFDRSSPTVIQPTTHAYNTFRHYAVPIARVGHVRNPRGLL